MVQLDRSLFRPDRGKQRTVARIHAFLRTCRGSNARRVARLDQRTVQDPAGIPRSVADGDTRVPHKASVMSSTRRTETPARYISIKAEADRAASVIFVCTVRMPGAGVTGIRHS
jgi:hypothetical protein